MADFNAVYFGQNKAAALIESVFDPAGPPQSAATKSLAKLKKTLIQSLHAAPKGNLDSLTATLARFRPLVSASPAVAGSLFSGSDIIDGLVSAYRTMHPPLRQAIIDTAYLCLMGLSKGQIPNLAMLSDQLFGLKAAADAHRDGPLRAEDSLVPELVSATPVLRKLRGRLGVETAASATVKTIFARLNALEEYRRPGAESEARKRATKTKRSRPVRSKVKAVEVNLGHGISDRRRTVIAQVQEVYPDLGQGFIARLMDECGEDANAVIRDLSDEMLPRHLDEADRSETL
jgi:activating signal cointegrator complex subunit 2